MGRRNGRSAQRRDYKMAVARSIDRGWAEQDARETACERSEAEDLAAGGDPSCRFVRDGSGLHVCTTSFGEMVRPGQSCWMEARQQILEQGAVIHAAEQAVQE